MSLVKTETIKEFSNDVKKALGDNVEEIILFGSYAKDSFVPGSDIDIAIIVKEKRPENEKEIWTIAEEYSSQHNVIFSPKIFEKTFFENKIEQNFSFYKDIENEGIKL